MDRMQVVVYIFLMLNSKSVHGEVMSQVVAQVGIATCIKRCEDNSACLSVAYDVARMSCEMYWTGTRQNVQRRLKSLTWVEMKRGKRHVKSNCHQKFLSSIVTRSQRTVCLLKLGFAACLNPPEVDNADVRLTLTSTEVVATYTCRKRFKSRPTSFTSTCSASRSWQKPQRGCPSSAPLLDGDIILPVGLNGKRKVTVCGIPEKGVEFSINLMRGKNVLLHMCSTHQNRKRRNQILFNALVNNKWKNPVVEKKFFPFAEHKEFCVQMYRRKRKYLMTIDGKKLSYSDRVPLESPNVVRLSTGVICVNVTMAY